MNRRKMALTGAAAAALVLAGGGAAIAGGAGDDDASDTPIPAPALEQAEQAALAETGGGTVTETEIDDEESYYEVEVTLENGDQVDVQLDKAFDVVGSKTESGGESESE